jgi:hypothetical protein
VIAFDAGTAETCYWTFKVPAAGFAATVTAVVQYMMASATSGLIDFDIAIEAITSGDATDLDATTSFDTTNTMTADTVPGTAGFMKSFSITLTNRDSWAAGDYVRLSLRRDAADATNDTATGDCYILSVEVRG